MRSRNFNKRNTDDSANIGAIFSGLRRRSSKPRGVAAVVAMVCLLSACGQETIAEGSASPATIDQGRLNSSSGDTEADPNGAGADDGESDEGNQAVLPGAAPISDATGPGQQGWLPIVNGPVQPDADGAIRGSIDSPGKVHVYTFEAIANQHVMVDQLGGCSTTNGDRLSGRLEGPGDSGSIDFRSGEDNCFDIEEFVFTGTGTATLKIEGGDSTTTGNYAFRLIDTTTPPPIVIGDQTVVSLDSPEPGAGHIEQTGYNDHYQFEVTKGDAFTIQQLGCSLDRDNSLDVRFSSTLFESVETDGYLSSLSNDCDSIDRFVAEETGTINMFVWGSDKRLSGTYSFALNFVNDGPNEIQPIALGNAAEPTSAPVTTGAIEELGEHEIFTFDLVKDQAIAIQQMGNCEYIGGTSLVGKAVGAGLDETIYFSEGDCKGVDWYRATETGAVQLTFYANSSDTTGSFDFRILDIPIPEDIQLQSGDVVGPNQPTDGAGTIDAIGGWDKYLIDVEDNQVVTIVSTGPCAISDSLTLKVKGVTTDETNYLYPNRDECMSELVFEAEETGTLEIVVSDQSYKRALGTYGFKITVN